MSGDGKTVWVVTTWEFGGGGDDDRRVRAVCTSPEEAERIAGEVREEAPRIDCYTLNSLDGQVH